ncbi:MAG TPA: hypothetical protein PLV92_24830, partial [Pirellulaceae bacterium]|nr:hypothetical protein [Pirellulaceae bacterium]
MILDTTDLSSELLALTSASDSPVDRSIGFVNVPEPSESASTARSRIAPSHVEPSRSEPSRTLIAAEVAQLERQGCTAEDWGRVQIAPSCDLTRVRFAHFLGDVRLG